MARPEDRFRGLESARVKLKAALDLVRWARGAESYGVVTEEWFDGVEAEIGSRVDALFREAYKQK